ncbi:MAG: ABC transporter substrate-binding protein [Candidatus Obscuribacterales bacterium]|nr:ABC transporter substrate-binding protein [Candidatus Obscuribacterales bacterium]
MKKDICAIVVATFLGLTGCAREGADEPVATTGTATATTATTASTTIATATATASANGVTATTSDKNAAGGGMSELPPNPGPFKLVEIKTKSGEPMECWQGRGEVGEFGGTMTVSTFGSGPKTFNVWSASDVESHGIGLLLFDPLIVPDAWTGQYIPRLAKSFEVSPDKCEYTFHLRKGVKWSDGKPLTADDVVFTYGIIVGKGFGNSSLRDVLSVYGKYPKVWKVDDLTVKFRTDQPFAPFLNGLTSIGIAPKHVVEPVTKKPMEEFNRFWDTNAKPESIVCCGPFKLSRYVPSQRVELVRNPNYHFVDANQRQLPYLDKFVQSIVRDQSTQILKFYARELDMLDIRSVKGSDVAEMKKKSDEFKSRTPDKAFTLRNLGPDDGTLFLMFNLCQRTNPEKKKPYVEPKKQKWFNNTKFRQAVNHAISRKMIINNALRGVGAPLFTAETPASLYLNKDLKAFDQDLEYSANLLKDAGFVKKGDKLYDAEGNVVEFTLNTNSGNVIREAVCNIIHDDLQKLGIKVNNQAIDFNVLVNKTENSLDWDAIVMGLSGTRLEPYGGANVWKSDGRLHMFDQRLPNKSGKVLAPDARPWEKKIDLLFDKGATTLDDVERHKIFGEFQQIAYDEVPFIYLYCPLLVTAAYDDIGNYKPTPYGINYTPLGSMHNIEEIYKKGQKH